MALSKPKVRELLESDAFIARVIRDTAEIDWEISLILVRFYTAQARFYEFSENIIDRFSFAQKIDILRKLRLSKKFKSQVSAVSVCEKLRKIRNLLAHSSYVPEESLDSALGRSRLTTAATRVSDDVYESCQTYKA